MSGTQYILLWGNPFSAGRMTRERSAKFKLLEKIAIEAAPAAHGRCSNSTLIDHPHGPSGD